MISKKNELKRLEFSKQYQNHSSQFWCDMLYADEKRFDRIPKHRKRTIWKEENTAYEAGSTQAYTRSKSVMVWECLGANGAGDLAVVDTTMNAIKYRDLLRKHLRSSARKIELKRGWMFLQDNDPKDSSKIVQSELKGMNIKCINHPPQSPNMNPMENLWDGVERKVLINDRSNDKRMLSAIQREWNSITPETCKKLAMSMSKRIKELEKNRGRVTHY